MSLGYGSLLDLAGGGGGWLEPLYIGAGAMFSASSNNDNIVELHGDTQAGDLAIVVFVLRAASNQATNVNVSGTTSGDTHAARHAGADPATGNDLLGAVLAHVVEPGQTTLTITGTGAVALGRLIKAYTFRNVGFPANAVVLRTPPEVTTANTNTATLPAQPSMVVDCWTTHQTSGSGTWGDPSQGTVAEDFGTGSIVRAYGGITYYLADPGGTASSTSRTFSNTANSTFGSKLVLPALPA